MDQFALRFDHAAACVLLHPSMNLPCSSLQRLSYTRRVFAAYVQIKALAMTLTEAVAALAAALQSRAGTGASLTPELKDLLQAAALPAASPGALADAVVASLTGISAADKQVRFVTVPYTDINSKFCDCCAALYEQSVRECPGMHSTAVQSSDVATVSC
jgi:hypothetical protein